MSSSDPSEVPSTFKTIVDSLPLPQFVRSWIRRLWLPIILPLMAYKFMWVWIEKKRRHALHGKVVLVTGASSGVGRSIAKRFFEIGCRVILCSRNEQELNEVRDELMTTLKTQPTFPPVVLPMDLGDTESLKSVAEAALNLHGGRIHILVNCGGIGYRGAVADTSLDVDIRLMLVNYFGQVALTREILPSMRAAGEGHIVFISSVQGKIAIPERSSYAASKHALGAFSDCLRAELAAAGIEVSLIAPAYIRTSFSINAVTGAGDKYGVMDSTTASGMSPDDVARRVLRAVLRREKEVVLGPLWIRIAIVLRYICPSAFFLLMSFRARKAPTKKIEQRIQDLKDD